MPCVSLPRGLMSKKGKKVGLSLKKNGNVKKGIDTQKERKRGISQLFTKGQQVSGNLSIKEGVLMTCYWGTFDPMSEKHDYITDINEKND